MAYLLERHGMAASTVPFADDDQGGIHAGGVPGRSEGRDHRVRLNISGSWDQAQGVDVDARATGLR